MRVIFKITEERIKQNLSISELARISGVSKTTISEIENGKHDTTVTTVCMIADALNVKLDDIVKWEK